MADSIRVLLVDDSAFVRQAVLRMLTSLPGVEVVASVSNGTEGIALARALRPDVIVLDVNLPDRNGLDVLATIMEEAPTGVLMLSTLTREDADITMRALELGAVDFVDKASAGTAMDIHRLEPVIQEKVLAVAGAALPGGRSQAKVATPADPSTPIYRPAPDRIRSAYDLVVIGASTGGPRALMEVIGSLPADFGAAVIAAQHMPAGFTRTLAERINRRSPLSVSEAADGSSVLPGQVLIAPGGSQIRLSRESGQLRTRISDTTGRLLHRPSVDLLFRSAAETVGSRAIGVVLTGMGDDGALGLQALRETGARTIAESQETAVIYGMPRAAAPAAEQILPLEDIARALVALCSAGADSRGGA